MSATLQASKFAEYFGGCPVLSISGRLFPVQTLFLEDALLQTNYLAKRDGKVTAPDL